MCLEAKKEEGGGWRGEKRLRRGQDGKGGVREQGTTGPETFMAVRKEELPTDRVCKTGGHTISDLSPQEM